MAVPAAISSGVRDPISLGVPGPITYPVPPERSERGAVDVGLGKILEKIAPALDGFGYPPRDCRALFEPIDDVVFNGLARKGRVESLAFVDIKTGGRLNPHPEAVKAAVEAGRVSWERYGARRRS